DDRLRLIAERIAGLRIFKLYDSDDISGLRFVHFVERFPAYHMQCAEALCGVPRTVEDGRIGSYFTAHYLHYIDATRKRIGDRAENVSRERFVGRIFSIDPVAGHIIVLESVFGLMCSRIRSEFYNMVKQDLQADQRGA